MGLLLICGIAFAGHNLSDSSGTKKLPSEPTYDVTHNKTNGQQAGSNPNSPYELDEGFIDNRIDTNKFEENKQNAVANVDEIVLKSNDIVSSADNSYNAAQNTYNTISTSSKVDLQSYAEQQNANMQTLLDQKLQELKEK